MVGPDDHGFFRRFAESFRAAGTDSERPQPQRISDKEKRRPRQRRRPPRAGSRRRRSSIRFSTAERSLSGHRRGAVRRAHPRRPRFRGRRKCREPRPGRRKSPLRRQAMVRSEEAAHDSRTALVPKPKAPSAVRRSFPRRFRDRARPDAPAAGRAGAEAVRGGGRRTWEERADSRKGRRRKEELRKRTAATCGCGGRGEPGARRQGRGRNSARNPSRF